MSLDPGSVSVSPFLPDYRASGILLHVTSLPSPYGIGDLGPTAFSWIDRLAQTGQRWWQMLPLGPTGYGNSPYQPISSFAGSELLISPGWLIEDELLRAGDCVAPAFPQDKIDFDAVIPFKQGLLQKAWANFKGGAGVDLRPVFERFRADQSDWLENYALFRTLKARFGGAYYLEWPAEFVRRDAATLDRVRREEADQIDRICFEQFLLHRQSTRATSGRTRNSSCWTRSTGRASSRACHPIISVRMDSFGAIQFTTGKLSGSPIIAGASRGYARCWLTST
jgi:4-alpha-glucanotransferase